MSEKPARSEWREFEKPVEVGVDERFLAILTIRKKKLSVEIGLIGTRRFQLNQRNQEERSIRQMVIEVPEPPSGKILIETYRAIGSESLEDTVKNIVDCVIAEAQEQGLI